MIDATRDQTDAREATRDGEETWAEGTIRSIVEDRGFGFIRPDNGRGDLFFHCSALMDTAWDYLQVGDRVTFTQEPDPRAGKGPRAREVRLLQANPARITPTSIDNPPRDCCLR